MSSTQRLPRPSQNASSAPSQSVTRTLIFATASLDESNKQTVLRNFRRNYSGVKNIFQVYLEDNDRKLTDAVRVDLKSDSLAKQYFDRSLVLIDGKQYSIQSLTRSVIVSKVASGEQEANLLQDLSHNYIGIERISRLYDINGESIDNIRIDFKSDASPTKIIKDNYILIDGKRRSVQPYWTLIFSPSQKNEACASEQPQKPLTNQPQKPLAKQPQTPWTKQPQTSWTEQSQKPLTNQPQKPLTEQPQKPLAEQPQTLRTEQPRNYLTERRVIELFKEQQMQLEAMINAFENKWNARLSSLSTSSTNVNGDQLLPIFKDLTATCQQFNQQNAQMQRQLGSVANRVQDVQIKLNNEQVQTQLPIQNGH